jgi:hypothetical protein
MIMMDPLPSLLSQCQATTTSKETFISLFIYSMVNDLFYCDGAKILTVNFTLKIKHFKIKLMGAEPAEML